MKKELLSALLGLAAATSLSLVSAEAGAVQPVPKGVFAVAAERMVGFSATFPKIGDSYFSTSLLASSNPAPLHFPRIGFDYFVIDGLSIGGVAGMSYNGATDDTYWVLQPRVGYSFAISQSFDFWPRGGLGVAGTNGHADPLLSLEAMFVWRVMPNVGVELGPVFDSDFNNATAIGGTSGLLVNF